MQGVKQFIVAIGWWVLAAWLFLIANDAQDGLNQMTAILGVKIHHWPELLLYLLMFYGSLALLLVFAVAGAIIFANGLYLYRTEAPLIVSDGLPLFCLGCGAQLAGNETFCGECGAKVRL